MINDLQKGGLANDLRAIAAALEVAGLLPNFHVDINKPQDLLQDSQFVTAVAALVQEFQHSSTANGFAAGAAAASAVASKLSGESAKTVTAIASVLGDISQMFSGSSGPGSLEKDAQYFEDVVSTTGNLINAFGGSEAAVKALGKLASGVGDVLAVIQGFQEGGVLGGIQAGFSADALAEILGATSTVALPIGIAIGLAALFFGGNHDNPTNMPDKYDTQNYGQQTANLQGTMGANGQSFTENPQTVALFSGRTGIQMVEEVLAQYGSAENAPDWLKPMFNNLLSMFGESPTGAGKLSIGVNGTGKDCNNQQVIYANGVNGQEYQYTQLDSALNQFMTAYAQARAAGQAAAMTWDSAASPGSLPPSDTYGATSYQSEYQYYA